MLSMKLRQIVVNKAEIQRSTLAMKTQIRGEANNARTAVPPAHPKKVPRAAMNKTTRRDQFDGIRLRGSTELKSKRVGTGTRKTSRE